MPRDAAAINRASTTLPHVADVVFVRILRAYRQTVLCPKGHWSPAPAGGVFRGAEISGLNFKINGSDFKIRATNFFLTPMWCLRVENQFSILATKKCRFSVPVLCGSLSVLARGSGWCAAASRLSHVARRTCGYRQCVKTAAAVLGAERPLCG